MAKKIANQKKASFDWHEFLKHFSLELLADEELRDRLEDSVLESGWLGLDAATGGEIANLQERLQTELPPSYHSFLKTSNGWRATSPFIDRVFSTAEVGWFRELNEGWVTTWQETGRDLPPVTDEEYFIYGDEQNGVAIRLEYLASALQISDVGDSAVYLLNPEVVTPDGEWEAWFFANWIPGAARYRSFRELMEAERKSWRESLAARGLKPITRRRLPGLLRARHRESQSKLPGSTKKAQLAARRGEIDAAATALLGFQKQGDLYAAASLAEIRCFRGQWDELLEDIDLLLPSSRDILPGFTEWELLGIVALAGRQTGRWQEVRDAANRARVDISTCYVAGFMDLHEIKVKSMRQNFLWHLDKLIVLAERQGDPPNEFPTTIELLRGHFDDSSDPSFNAALHKAWKLLEQGQPDEAWDTILARLPDWWPLPNLQIAPIELLLHEQLRTLMTPERCQLVLSMPRGPENQPRTE